jgi:hypothetical protein
MRDTFLFCVSLFDTYIIFALRYSHTVEQAKLYIISYLMVFLKN